MSRLQDLKPHFSGATWPLLWTLMVGLFLSQARKTLSELTSTHSVSALSRFLNRYAWPTDQLRQWRQAQITRAIRDRYLGKRGRNPTLYLLIDNTVIAKRGGAFPGLGQHYSSTHDRVAWGHNLVFSYLLAGGVQAPWDWRLYVNERFCLFRRFRTKTDLACELIRHFQPPYAGKVVVVVDAGYFCADVVRAARERGFRIVGRVKRNRRLACGLTVPELSHGQIGWLRGMDVAMQFTWTGSAKAGRRFIAGNDLDVKPAMIRVHFRRRWMIETFFQIAKGQFGLGDYRLRSWTGIHRWIELVLLAYTVSELERDGASWAATKARLLRRLAPVISEVRRSLTAQLIATLQFLTTLLRLPPETSSRKEVAMPS